MTAIAVAPRTSSTTLALALRRVLDRRDCPDYLRAAAVRWLGDDTLDVPVDEAAIVRALAEALWRYLNVNRAPRYLADAALDWPPLTNLA